MHSYRPKKTMLNNFPLARNTLDSWLFSILAKLKSNGVSHFHWRELCQFADAKQIHCAKYSDTIQRDLREIPGLWPNSLTGRG